MNAPRVEIRYCVKRGWVLRAAGIAQALLANFGDSLSEVALRPGGPNDFEICVEEHLAWCRQRDGNFPTVDQAIQRVNESLVAIGDSQ